MPRAVVSCLVMAVLALVGCGDDDGGNQNNNNGALPGVCGDGTLDSGEECDNGAANSDSEPDACRSTCRQAFCGDWVSDTGEACDEGAQNGRSPSVCRADCTLNVCGDGYLGGDEACDDGNTVSDDGCRGDCGLDETLCDNGVLDPGEECDNGPLNSDELPNACRTDCLAARCGDGVQDAGEACDDGNNVDDLQCSANCGNFCGDGVYNPHLGEECDDGPHNGESPSVCQADCTLNLCGDGYLGGDEECDDASANSDTEPDVCRLDCLTPRCGDGVIDPGHGEECDDTSANSDTEPDACRLNCQAPSCGDGVVDPGLGEQCDGANLNGQTCEGVGFGGGNLLCAPGCALNTSLCQGWTQIATGAGHTCGLRADGTVRCWGANHRGQLGDGTTQNSVWPVQVVGIGPAIAVTVGIGFTCALTDTREVYCWGANEVGQLGDSTLVDRLQPTPVLGVSDASSISASVAYSASHKVHACASTTSGALYCWGGNAQGELGDGSFEDRPTPVAVTGLTDVTQVSAGEVATCAIQSGGQAWCWGATLGNGTWDTSEVPVPVSGMNDAVAIDVRTWHGCAIRRDGTLWCWGNNGYDALGTGGGNTNVPVQVPNLPPVAQVSLSRNFSSVLTVGGQVYSWGSGYLGNAGVGASATPLLVAGLSQVRQISTRNHACVIDADRRARCWGANMFGELGAGVPLDPAQPVQVTGLGDVRDISTSGHFSCAVNGSLGAVYCWGGNGTGRLGAGTLASSPEPIQVWGLLGATEVSCGGAHACAVRDDGSAWCWGDNGDGQLGDGTQQTSLVPVEVQTPAAVAHIAAGGSHSCAVLVDETVWCWGKNAYRQIGNGDNPTNQINLTPVRVETASGVPLAEALSVSTYVAHGCAATRSGTVYCWGRYPHSWSALPWATPVAGLPASTLAAASTITGCAMTADTGMQCWGVNGRGQLGDGTLVSRVEPAPVLDAQSQPLTGVEAIDIGMETSAALLSDGTVWFWGSDNPVPTPFASLGHAVDLAVGVSGGNLCVVEASGVALCKGSNAHGQLGNGQVSATDVPVLVLE